MQKIILQIRQLLALQEVAPKNDQRPYLNSIQITPKYAQTSDGHILLRVELDNATVTRNVLICNDTALALCVKGIKAKKYDLNTPIAIAWDEESKVAECVTPFATYKLNLTSAKLYPDLQNAIDNNINDDNVVETETYAFKFEYIKLAMAVRKLLCDTALNQELFAFDNKVYRQFVEIKMGKAYMIIPTFKVSQQWDFEL